MAEAAGGVAGRGVVVLGGTGALGRAVVAALKQRGARVAITGRRAETVQARASELGVEGLVGDASDPAGARSLVEQARAVLGEVFGVVNVAGAFSWAPIAGMDDGLLDRMLRANLHTMVHMTRAALPGMVEGGGGFLVGVASVQAWQGGAPGVAAYAASKAALLAFMRSLRAELAGTGVRVTVLVPMGIIDSAANRADMPDADPADWLSPDALAAVLCHALETPPDAQVFELPVYPRHG